MAALTASKAKQVKKDCQGEDHPEYATYVEFVRRINAKSNVKHDNDSTRVGEVYSTG
jgi:hypothetical protein